MSNVNVRRLVENIRSGTNIYTPLVELVVNAIQAIDARGIPNGLVEIEVLRNGQADRGLLVCGSGAGVSVAASKFPGIRAAVCHDTYTARQAVEHDDMNVLCLGARVIGPALARALVEAFVAASFSAEERHLRRLAKVDAIESRFARDK